MPSLNSFETDMKRARRKKRAKRNLKNFTFIMAVLIIAGLIYLSRDAWLDYFDGILDRHEASAVQNDGALAGGNYPIDISKKTHTRIGKISRYWTLFADTTFYVYNSSGDIEYSAQMPYSNPICCEAEKRTLVYDQGGYSFAVAGPNDIIYQKRLSDQILLGTVGPDGSVGIVTANEKYLAYLTVYDKSGSEIYHWADGSMITAVDIEQNGKGCLVSSSYARGGTYKTVVTRLDLSSTENAGETSPIETLGFGLKYLKSGGFWLIGRDRLCRVNQDGGVEMSFGYEYELKDYFASKELAALVFESVGGGGGLVSVISDSASEPVNIRLTENICDIYVSDGTVYILTDSSVAAYNSAGELLATAPLDITYRSFTVNGGEVFLLGYRSVEKIEFDY